MSFFFRDISTNELTGAIPPELGQLGRLQYLQVILSDLKCYSDS
jgi:hypothetical protein